MNKLIQQLTNEEYNGAIVKPQLSFYRIEVVNFETSQRLKYISYARLFYGSEVVKSVYLGASETVEEKINLELKHYQILNEEIKKATA